MTPGGHDGPASFAVVAPIRLGYGRPGRGVRGARDWRLGVTCLGLLVLGLVLFVGGLAGLVGVDLRSIGQARVRTS